MSSLISFGIIGIIYIIVLDILMASVFADIAKDKGYTHKVYFVYSLLFGIAGWLIVIALPDRGKRETISKKEEEIPEL